MADNVAITAGTGTTVAADEVTDGTLGSCKVQFVKLMDGTLDGTTKAAVGANGLAVNHAAIYADDADWTDGTSSHALVGGLYQSTMQSVTDGDVGPFQIDVNGKLKVDGGKAHIVRVTPTITVPGTAYSANDCFGGEMTITSAARVSGGSGILTGITMSFEDDIAVSTIEVLIFDSNPAGTYTDNTALAVVDADTYLLLGSVILDVKTDTGDGALLKAHNVNIPYVCSGSADLYAVAVIRNSVPTPTATDAAQFTFHLIRD